MKLSNLKQLKGKIKASKRVGRGESSGKGKTAAKGMKGQKVRGSIPLIFEGGQLPIIKRLPFQRGVGNKSLKGAVTLTLADLNKLNSGEIVDIATLKKYKLLPKNLSNYKVKLVAKGTLEKPLTVKIPVSRGAEVAIEKAKGKVEG